MFADWIARKVIHLMCLLIVLLGATPTWAGRIEYPLAGHLEFEQGTLELWFSPLVEFAASPGVQEYRGLSPLMSMQTAAFTMSGSCFAKNGQLMIGFSMSHLEDRRALLPVVGQAPAALVAGRRQHLALRWRERVMEVWLNGKRIGERRQARMLEGSLVGQFLYVGHERPAPIVVHAIRLSCVDRSDEALGQSQPVADTFTLLLDRFDAPDHVAAGGQTQAQVISGLTGETGGVVRGPWQFIDGAEPGIALAPPTSPQ